MSLLNSARMSAALGPAILLSLFWKRFNFKGAIAGIVIGSIVDICWIIFLSDFGLYELFPGFVCGLIGAVAVTLCTKKPSEEVEQLFDKAVKYED